MKKIYTKSDWDHENYCKSLQEVQAELKFFQKSLGGFLAQTHSPETLSLARKFRSDFSKKLYETQQLLDKLQEAGCTKPQVGPQLLKEYNRIYRSYEGLKDCFELFLQEARIF